MADEGSISRAGVVKWHCTAAGDQEDVSVLNEIVDDAALFSGYDVIVDDGGHKSSQMLTTFRVSHPLAHVAS